MRSANNFVVVLAFLQVACRVLQLGGVVMQSEFTSQLAYRAATVMICLMLLTSIVKEKADIIAEIMPTDEQLREEEILEMQYGRHNL
jgi:hypothetical protein